MNRRDDLRAEVIAERVAQGLDPEPSDETLAFVGTVIANDCKAPAEND